MPSQESEVEDIFSPCRRTEFQLTRLGTTSARCLGCAAGNWAGRALLPPGWAALCPLTGCSCWLESFLVKLSQMAGHALPFTSCHSLIYLSIYQIFIECLPRVRPRGYTREWSPHGLYLHLKLSLSLSGGLFA